MKIKSILLYLLSICGMFLLISCDSGSSSVSDYDPTAPGQQQKSLAIGQMSSPEARTELYNLFRAEGFSHDEAQEAVTCYQPEVVNLINNTPSEQFNVSESEAYKLGEKIGNQAAEICIARLYG